MRGGRRRTAARWRFAVLRAVLACGGVAGFSLAAAAQNIQTYFPAGNAGYDQQLGVTVLTRLRPLYETPGVRVGSFVISPNLDESLFYNSNLNGVPGSGSWGMRTSGAVSASSDWVRNSLAATIGFASNRFFTFPNENFVDWNVGLAGGYTINDSQLQAAYSHQTSHMLGTTIATTSSQAPVLNQTDSGDLTYTFHLGDLAIIPDVNVSAYRFGPAIINGRTFDQSFLNRNVLAGGVDARYSLSEEGSVLVVLRGATSDYVQPVPGQPSNNSYGLQMLAGIDYQGEGVWRYRLLLGMQRQAFQAAQYASQVAPVTEAGVIWTPTGLTTVTGNLSREIEDPTSAGTIGFVATRASLVVDHELMPNVFLQARGSDTYVQYLLSGGDTQNNASVGAGATWLLNRNMRLALNYDFTWQTAIAGVAGVAQSNPLVTGAFTQHLVMLTLHLNL